MMRSFRSAAVAALWAFWSTAALAQSTPSQSSTSSQTSSQPASSQTEQTRPATTTFFGDTGIWFVPTAEVLGNGTWSVSGYRRGTNYIQGYTNVSDFAGTFGIGIKGRAEIFGSFLVDTRIDRDIIPIFTPDPKVGGVIDRYPRLNQPWSGDQVGDLYVGIKYNLLSQYRQNPAAVAVRGLVKIPTDKNSAGVGTGKADVEIDGIVSKEAARLVEVSGYAGYERRGQPNGFTTPTNAFHWGGGVTFPSRNFLRVFGEVNGTATSANTVTLTAPLLGVDLSPAPLVSNTENLTRATVGLTLQTRRGFFVGAGASWNVPTQARELAHSADGDVFGDYVDYQIRVGYHPGVPVYVAPAPPPPPPPPPLPPPQNRPPTVKANCDPCTVEVGKTSTVSADARDPDGDPLTYRWTAPSGTLANPAAQSTIWTAPNQEGTVPVTVTVDDGHGGRASDTVNIQVIRPPQRTYTFEDVHFDFDRYSLRPEATRILDEAVNALRQDPTLRVTVEGHTCNIGTAEYNLALGNRRATAVRDYLVSRGVTADRLNTISYGEERPKYDNAREETRRLNRRAAMVVRLQ